MGLLSIRGSFQTPIMWLSARVSPRSFDINALTIVVGRTLSACTTIEYCPYDVRKFERLGSCVGMSVASILHSGHVDDEAISASTFSRWSIVRKRSSPKGDNQPSAVEDFSVVTGVVISLAKEPQRITFAHRSHTDMFISGRKRTEPIKVE